LSFLTDFVQPTPCVGESKTPANDVGRDILSCTLDKKRHVDVIAAFDLCGVLELHCLQYVRVAELYYQSHCISWHEI